MDEDGLVIDIGASMGIFSLRCAFERNCMVYAYEPSYSSFSILKENVFLNGLENKIQFFNLAVGRKHEKRQFYFKPEHPGGSSLYDTTGTESIVQCTTLKHIFEDNSIKKCDVLKIDCEMAEREIFTNESSDYFKRTSYIALEWHNYDGHLYEDYLRHRGFSTLLTGCGDPPPPYDITFGRGMLYGWML